MSVQVTGTVANLVRLPGSDGKKARRIVQLQVLGHRMLELVNVMDYADDPFVCNLGQVVTLPVQVQAYADRQGVARISYNYYGGATFGPPEPGAFARANGDVVDVGKGKGKKGNGEEIGPVAAADDDIPF